MLNSAGGSGSSINWSGIYGQNNVAGQMLSDISLSQYESMTVQPLIDQLSSLQNQLKPLQTEQSAWKTLQADASAMNQALTTMGSSTTWSAETATTSDSSILSAAADGTAVPGTYTFSVSQLALTEIDGTASTAMTITSPTAALNLTAGTVTLSAGSVSVSVAVTSTTTLDQLASALQSTGAPWTTQVTESPSGTYYLQLFGTTPNQPLQYGGVLGDWANVGMLSASSASSTGYATNVVQSAQGAVLNLDNAQYLSNTNTFTNVLPGVTLTAQGIGKATITTQPDISSMSQAVQGMVGDWNQWVQDTFTLAFGTLPPTGSGTSMTFAPNPKQEITNPMPVETINAISQELTGYTLQGTGLADYGVTVASGAPTLSINSASLSSMIQQNPATAQQFFTALASTLSGWVTTFSQAQGVAATALSTLSNTQTRLQQQETNVENEVSNMQQSAQSQYTSWMNRLTGLAQTDQLLTQMQSMNSGSGSGG